MIKSIFIPIAVLALSVAWAPVAFAHTNCVSCGTASHGVSCGSSCVGCGVAQPCGGCGGCGVQYIEKVVMVPTWETETRTITTTEYRYEPQPRTRLVSRCVPVQVERQRTVNDCVPQVATKVVHYTECVPVTEQVEKTWVECVAVPRMVEQTCNVMVPELVERIGTRMVCETYQEQVVRRVTCDQGHWATQMVEVPVACGCGRGCASPCHRRPVIRRRRCNDCGSPRCRVSCNGCSSCVTCGVVNGCGGCGGCAPATTVVCQRVWVPNIVTQEIPTTVTRSRMVPQEYTYTECVYVSKPVTRTVRVMDYEQVPRSKMVNVTRYERHQRTKEVQYTSYVLKPRIETYMATEYKTVTEEVTDTVNVCVPYRVEKVVDVPVCRYVPKTVTVPVTCGSCCSGRPGILSRLFSHSRRLCCSGCNTGCWGCY